MFNDHGTARLSKTNLRLSHIRLLIAGALLIIAACAMFMPSENSVQLFSALQASAQESSSVNSASTLAPPSSLQTSAPNVGSSAGRQVLIDFNDLPFYTAVTGQYPDAVFSSDAGDYVITTPQNYGTSLPSISRAYLYGFWVDGNPPYNHFAPLVVDFPKGVNDLAFHLLASDDIGVIASIDVYQNNVYTKTEPVFGNGNPFSPIWINLGAAGYKNVTRIVIGRISDRKGLAFDNFSFTVPTATPTPTPSASPTPTPPPAPANVNATPDEERIAISWTPSQGAGWYVIKRADAPAPTSASTASNAVASDSLAFASINPTFFCDGVSVPCIYEDNNSGAGLSSDTLYSYVVAAVNNSGTSADSNPPATAKPLPKPGCQASTKQRPSSRNVTRHGWNMEINVTDTEGLQLRSVSLNGRLMAESMSVPYYRLSTKTAGRSPGPNLRGQLKPASSDQSLRSRLIAYDVNETNPSKLVVMASYAIDHIPDTPKACLNIVQQYEFYREGFGGRCEPSGTASCSRFRPMVTYNFYGGEGESLTSLNIPQRNHYQVKGAAGNTVGVFLDADTRTEGLLNLGFPAKMNPVTKEFWSPIIGRVQGAFASGQSPSFRFDNFHQTNQALVKEPPLSPGIQPELHIIGAGCLECVHNHWRWGAFFGPQWGNGFPLIPLGSNQTVDIGVVRYPGQVNSQQDWLALVNGEDLYTTVPQDPVFWFSPTGYLPSDVFFSHYAWFNPHPPASGVVNIQSAASPSSSTNSQDGPVSVIFGDVYQPGSTNFDAFDLSTLAPLPAGYAPLNNAGYMITTTALVSGPHVINFSAASVTDQATFNNLRIFHPEPDPFDPDKFLWVDKTILSPDTPGPDFSAKLLSAKTEGLGVFVIGNLVQNIPPSTDVANLAVTCSDSSDPITAGNNLTYTIRVTNNGPQNANNVGIRNGLSPDAKFVSATSSQGACKEIDGTVYCNLNSLSVNATATVSLVVQPTEGTGTFPIEGKTIYNGSLVKANETDNDLTNNSATESTNVLPNPNKAPSVSITSPMTGALMAGPTNITINANATDSDGTISKVEFFDNGELIGVGSQAGNNQYVITKQNASFGDHSFLAVATDNGGRQNTSNVANVIVNGAASVSLTSPLAGALYAPGSNITLTANAAHPSGIINKVEFFRNGESLGLGTPVGGGQYNMPWSNVDEGIYSIVAVATDGSGITTTSAPLSITVDSPPTVNISTPIEGAVFPSATTVSVSATAQSARASVVRVDFYASGVLIGSAADAGTNQFTFTWRHVPDGFYSLTASATDSLGITTTSAPITIGVNVASPTPGELIWFDDDVPAGATKYANGDADWYWVDANPAPLSGTKSHQSRNFGQANPSNSFHQHYFDGATATLPVNAGDTLFTYVFLDMNSLPREIMLQWKDANNWEHRAYWGENRINNYGDGDSIRLAAHMGPLPQPGKWTRLEVPASDVGLEGSTLNGMAFTLDGGRATFDLAGKTTANAPPRPTTPPGDFVWMDDAVPDGSISETINDQWQWLPPHVCGNQGHRSFFTVNQGAGQFRSHSFRNASTKLSVNPGDVLFTYVYLDLNHMPDQIMLQWHDGSSWEHRAFWGENYIGQKVSNMGVQGTESQRYMGGLPPGNQWVRLEVPASYVGLEGKTVSGMAFGFYSKVDHAGINWDCSGKSAKLTTTPLPLLATAGVSRFKSKQGDYAYDTNDQGPPAHDWQKIAFYANPNQAAGTVPFYRFHSQDNVNYFYSRCSNCTGANLIPDGIAFYVYPDGTTPGTVPLYLYHDSVFHYFLTTDQSEATGETFDGPWAYVFPFNPQVPAAPTAMGPGGCCFSWLDNSANETGFRVEALNTDTGVWNLMGTVGANADSYCSGGDLCIWRPGKIRVQAFNEFGNSNYSNVFVIEDNTSKPSTAQQSEFNSAEPANSLPYVNIVGPANGDGVDRNFAITANSFDLEGNGTIVKVEFFANDIKLGEVADAPYVFEWNNVAPGSHTLTAIATDNMGATTTSAPISITVNNIAPIVSITSPTNGALFTAPSDITISASASDSDGNVSKVEFFQGSTKLGETTSAPYNFVWNNVTGGSYSLTAVATDNLSASTVSSPVSIMVNNPPTISITTSSTQDVPTAPALITINAEASDPDGTISKVEFYQGGTLLGTALTSPYSYTWNNVAAGNYSITAKATDNLGAVTTSNTVILPVNTKPSVSLTTPLNGNYFTAPAFVSISASASDPDGSIGRVEFYRGSILISTVTTSPYTFNWSSVPAGTYTLTARAVDNVGASTMSSGVTITVTPNSLAIGKIAFASNRDGCAQIYLMGTDGTNQIRLTNDAGNDESPKWSPDNSRIVFQSDRDFQSDSDNPIYGWDIYVMNWDGSAVSRLTSAAYDDIAPVWSPDGTKIAFQSFRNGLNYQIYVMNADGSGQVNISNNNANDTQPSWSPDGSKIAFASDRDQAGFSSIYVMNANGINQTRVTLSGSGFLDEQPAWSPDGMKLAFITTRDSTLVTWNEWLGDGSGQSIVKSKLLINKEVYVMNADGTSQARLTNIMGNDDSPVWSPDGTKVAFRSDRDRSCCDPSEQVWVMNADGSNQVNLSNSNSGDYCPSWSR